MKQKILIIDTSILCEWLEIPGKHSKESEWNQERIDRKIEEEKKAGTQFLLPLAVLIETGNHVVQSGKTRREIAEVLSSLMLKMTDQDSPWLSLEKELNHWKRKGLKNLAVEFPERANREISFSDATIIEIAKSYPRRNFEVEIFTLDDGLSKIYDSEKAIQTPRRDRGKKF